MQCKASPLSLNDELRFTFDTSKIGAHKWESSQKVIGKRTTKQVIDRGVIGG